MSSPVPIVAFVDTVAFEAHPPRVEQRVLHVDAQVPQPSPGGFAALTLDELAALTLDEYAALTLDASGASRVPLSTSVAHAAVVDVEVPVEGDYALEVHADLGDN